MKNYVKCFKNETYIRVSVLLMSGLLSNKNFIEKSSLIENNTNILNIVPKYKPNDLLNDKIL